MKAYKLAILTLIGISLLSCDLFLSKPKDRLNPLDPANILTPVELTLTPVVDGYVSSPSIRDFNSTTIPLGMGSYSALIRFDLSGLPTYLTKAELKLYNQTNLLNNTTVYRIVQPWDPADISYSTVEGGTFYTSVDSIMINVPAGAYSTWDVTAIVKAGAGFGFVVKSSDAVTSSILTVESTTNKPQLVISGSNLP
jgi:hypothetical protein